MEERRRRETELLRALFPSGRGEVLPLLLFCMPTFILLSFPPSLPSSLPPSLPPSHAAVSLETFYFIDIQSLCEITEKENERFLPCEIAVAEFTLNSGIQKTMHKFIDPGQLPLSPCPTTVYVYWVPTCYV